MNTWQVLMTVYIGAGVAIAAWRHGQTVIETYDFREDAFGALILVAILIFGGFFG